MFVEVTDVTVDSSVDVAAGVASDVARFSVGVAGGWVGTTGAVDVAAGKVGIGVPNGG